MVHGVSCLKVTTQGRRGPQLVRERKQQLEEQQLE